ncbi:MAG: ATP-binding protein [Bacteroidota bacterium]
MKLVGRKAQIKRLQEALASPQPEMVALIGRRRVGKTFLIRETYKENIIFELTGLQNGSLANQLQNFALTFARFFPDEQLEDKHTQNWLAAFDRLAQAIEPFTKGDYKPVVFLDELPWLGTRKSDFIQALGYFWNSYASRWPIVVVICGSAASWMIEKVVNDKGGLHNRVTQILHLAPFTLAETEALCQINGITLPRYQILLLYMVMGGIPMYLQQIKPGLSAAQNIQAICFDRDGYLNREFSRLFASLFERYDAHVDIVRALAERRIGLTKPTLAAASGISNGGGLNRVLADLIESGFITEYGSYRKKRRHRLYRLTDFYSLFYLTYIERLGPAAAQTDFNKLSTQSSWRSWTGYAFENVCLTHIDQIKVALGISGIPTSAASFYAAEDTKGPGAQIDLLIERSDNTIHICEAKFTHQALQLSNAIKKVFEHKAAVFAERTKSKNYFLKTLLTTYPPSSSPHAYGIDQVVVLEDLFREV